MHAGRAARQSAPFQISAWRARAATQKIPARPAKEKRVLGFGLWVLVETKTQNL
jgi:hypothetical protein